MAAKSFGKLTRGMIQVIYTHIMEYVLKFMKRLVNSRIVSFSDSSSGREVSGKCVTIEANQGCKIVYICVSSRTLAIYVGVFPNSTRTRWRRWTFWLQNGTCPRTTFKRRLLSSLPHRPIHPAGNIINNA